MRFFEIDNLEMTTVEAGGNPLRYALREAISQASLDSEVLVDIDDILIAIEDDLVEYKSDVPLTGRNDNE